MWQSVFAFLLALWLKKFWTIFMNSQFKSLEIDKYKHIQNLEENPFNQKSDSFLQRSFFWKLGVGDVVISISRNATICSCRFKKFLFWVNAFLICQLSNQCWPFLPTEAENPLHTIKRFKGSNSKNKYGRNPECPKWFYTHRVNS